MALGDVIWQAGLVAGCPRGRVATEGATGEAMKIALNVYLVRWPGGYAVLSQSYREGYGMVGGWESWEEIPPYDPHPPYLDMNN